VTTTLWRIAATTLAYEASDLSGAGAKTLGGRWNPIGMPMVYTTENISLAVHETIVHLRSVSLPLNRYLVRIDVPVDIWAARQILSPPVGWDALPYGMPSVQAGEAWLKSLASVLLVVPSVIIPEEANILINPQHPDAARLTATALRKWLYDARFS